MSAQTAPDAVVILISGRGSNMRALIEHSLAADSPYRVSGVLADRPAGGLEVARDFGISTQILAPHTTDRAAYERELAAAVGALSPALVALAGFMRVLSAPFVQAFEGRIMNIHPSLLPRYAGLHTHRRVLAAHDAEHGATVHFVTETLDAGPAILQSRVEVMPGDSEAELAARVLETEHRMYFRAVRWFCEHRLTCAGGRAWFDGRALSAPLQLADVGK